MNFLLSGLTYLKYYVPLIEEGNRRGIRSSIFLVRSNKYSCPYESNNFQYIKECSKIYDFDLKSDVPRDGICFTIEGSHRELAGDCKKISLCYSTDFTVAYEQYIDEVDHVVMTSKFLAERYGKIHHKNLYLGSPKFDIKLSKEDIRKKYRLGDKKRAVIFYPRLRDINKCSITDIIRTLKEEEFEVVLKSREKDSFLQEHVRESDFSFYDVTWHPHTSLELIESCDIVINFSSTVIEETTFFRRPVVNFHVKPFEKPLSFLYDYPFVHNLSPQFKKEELKESVNMLLGKDFSENFKIARGSLMDSFNSSFDILEALL